MRIGSRVNQLHSDPHLVGRFLHATLKNIGYPKLLRDLGRDCEVCSDIAAWKCAKLLSSLRSQRAGSGSPPGYHQRSRRYRIGAEVFKRKHCDALLVAGSTLGSFPREK